MNPVSSLDEWRLDELRLDELRLDELRPDELRLDELPALRTPKHSPVSLFVKRWPSCQVLLGRLDLLALGAHFGSEGTTSPNRVFPLCEGARVQL